MIRAVSLRTMRSHVSYVYEKAQGARTKQWGAEMLKDGPIRRLHLTHTIQERRLKIFTPFRLNLLYFAFQK